MWTHKPQLQLLIIKTQRTEVYWPAGYDPPWQTKKSIMIFIWSPKKSMQKQDIVVLCFFPSVLLWWQCEHLYYTWSLTIVISDLSMRWLGFSFKKWVCFIYRLELIEEVKSWIWILVKIFAYWQPTIWCLCINTGPLHSWLILMVCKQLIFAFQSQFSSLLSKYCTSLNKDIRVRIHGCEIFRVHYFMIIWLYMYHQQNNIYQNQILQINIIENTFWLWRYSNWVLVHLIDKKRKSSSAWVSHRKDQTTTSIWHNTVVPFTCRKQLSLALMKGQRQSFWGFLCSQFKWRRQKKKPWKVGGISQLSISHSVVMWSLPHVVLSIVTPL